MLRDVFDSDLDMDETSYTETENTPMTAKAVRSFRDYFLLEEDVETILARFGYAYERNQPPLPRFSRDLPFVAELQRRLTTAMLRVPITGEAGKRELLVAPILFELMQHFLIKPRSEFPLRVSNQLRGTLDYLVEGAANLVVIEAKKDDLYRGGRQLAVEMVALDQSLLANAPFLYGAVTTGEAWRFTILDRVKKQVTQDINLLRVPSDLEELVRVLLGILVGEGEEE